MGEGSCYVVFCGDFYLFITHVFTFIFVGHTHQGSVGFVKDTSNIQSWLSKGLGL